MTQNPQDPMAKFEAALSRAALSKDPSRLQALREVLEELSGDALLPDQLAQYQAVLDLLQGPEMVEASPAWIDTAMARIRELNTESVQEQGWLGRTRDALADGVRGLEEVWATLVLDSYAGAALPGIRGNATMQPRQLMYESPGGTIHLQIDRGTDGRSDVMGQFLPTDGVLDKMEISLLSGPSTELSETGEFRFSNLDDGDLYLRIKHGDTLIQLEPIHVTSQEE